MLTCEGFRMFHGTAKVTPKNPQFEPFRPYGTWLYKPDYDCWYVAGHSYPASIVSEIEEDGN